MCASVSRLCKAVRKEVRVSGDGCGEASAKSRCAGVADDEDLARAKLSLMEENLSLVVEGGGGEAIGGGDDGRRLGVDGEPTGEVDVFFFAEVNGRRKDHSDSNWTDSNSDARGEWSNRVWSSS